MTSYGLNKHIDLKGSLSSLPGNVFIKLRNLLDHNPPDKNWEALVRSVDQNYQIPLHVIDAWRASDGPSGRCLTELSSQGMIVSELRDYLETINIDTFNFGLMPYKCISITGQPGESVDLYEGECLTLHVEATGSPYPRYQWFHCLDGEEQFKRLLGFTESTLRINGVLASHAGGYSCQLHNCSDRDKTKITDITLVSVKARPPELANNGLSNVIYSREPDLISSTFDSMQLNSTSSGDYSLGNSLGSSQPSTDSPLRAADQFSLITVHPQDTQVAINDGFVLSVETRGDPPISYQWYKDGAKLPGHELSKLCITGALPEDFGKYYCVVYNGIKKEQSRAATVKERCPLPVKNIEIEIISQPRSLVVPLSGSALFSVEASCTQPLRYQWFKDGQPIPRETNTDIKLVNIQDKEKMEGMYMCMISVATQPSIMKLTVTALLTVKIPSYFDSMYNPSDKVALLIGNADYKCETQLKAPMDDVQTLTEAFRSLNFKVVSLLNLTKPEIENAVLEFCQLIDRNVYAVFYFCGHGFEENGMSFLVPTDAPSAYKAEECVNAKMVLENIQKRQPPAVFMILDVCRQPGKVPSTSASIPLHLDSQTMKGNTVFCYATTEGMAAYENKTHGYGLLVKHLAPLLRKKVGLDNLVIDLKTAFAMEPKHSNIQIPELRSNLLESSRSLTDLISFKGQTVAYESRTLRWNNAHKKPETRTIYFEGIGASVELEFQSNFSNILHVFVTVTDPGQAIGCVGKITNYSARISMLGETRKFARGEKTATKTTLQDIQKLESNLVVDVTITFKVKYKQETYFDMRRVDLGLPLVSRLKLWQPSNTFEKLRREPIEQTEESDSTGSLEINK